MIRKLVAAAVVALIAAPLVSLHQLGAADVGTNVLLLSEDGALVFVVEVRGLVRLEPLVAAIVL
ncbi:MAG TPA: hypothetical protein VF547_08745 [Allosphingosinicella sp.]